MVLIMVDDPASTTRRARLRKATAVTPAQASPRSAAKRKTPRKISAKSLENAALFYLARFSAPGAHLRRVLLRRVDRSLRVHGGDRAEAQRLVDELIARFHRSGLLDDAAYASGKARGLRSRGASRVTIGRSLRAKGLSAAAVDAAIAGTLEDGRTATEADLAAAARLAQRKRLGPMRPASARAELRLRDLAALARAGFSYDIARRVVDAADADALESLIRGD
jgi:regulatory protein